MRYELECGHCGYQFVVSVVELPRTMKCAVCGGVLALARPLSIAPAPPEPPPELPEEAATADVPAPTSDGPTPGVRALFLASPWHEVRFALSCARPATNFATALVVILTIAMVGVPLTQPAGWWTIEAVPTCLCWAFLLPAAAHVACQWRCLKVPRTHGQGLANSSLMMMAVVPFGVLGLAPGPAVIFAIAGAVAAIIAFTFWLMFLTQLGEALGDDALTSKARSYRVRLPFELVLLVLLLAGAVLAARIPSPALVWIDRAAAGALGLVVLRQYSSLLQTAVRAIDTRAPVEMDR
jgi:hypothetical protein